MNETELSAMSKLPKEAADKQNEFEVRKKKSIHQKIF
jgi:hypothetical protein